MLVNENTRLSIFSSYLVISGTVTLKLFNFFLIRAVTGALTITF